MVRLNLAGGRFPQYLLLTKEEYENHVRQAYRLQVSSVSVKLTEDGKGVHVRVRLSFPFWLLHQFGLYEPRLKESLEAKSVTGCKVQLEIV